MGCGRVGSTMAARLDAEGHEVTVVDVDSNAFRRLPAGFSGARIVGSGVDERVLARAGLAEADAFIALTQGDNRNLFASQMAQQLFRVGAVVTRVYDPLRAELFARLGLRTFSPTRTSADLAYDELMRRPSLSERNP